MAGANSSLGTPFDPATAQPLPGRPGAMAAQPLRPKGQVTAGRPLPPRAGEPAPPASAVHAQPARPATALVAPSVEARTGRPDARPMRMAIGAGAVAAVSALTLGLVKPDFSGTGDEGSPAETSEEAAVDAQAQDRVRVRRVTDYVLLKPGEKAPPGATVISAAEFLGLDGPPARDVKGDSRDERPAQDAARQDRQPAPDTQREPAPKPDPPRVKTRQSGS